MGYLIDLGDTLCHDEVKGIAKYVKEHGILQLIQLLKQYANHKNVGELQWGYEIESHVVAKVDGKLKLFGDADLKYKNLDEINDKLKYAKVTMEYGAWMIEMIPRKSINLSTSAPEILDMMKKQLSEIREKVLDEGQHILSLPVYAKLGHGDYFTKPSIKKEVSSAELKGKMLNMVSNSKFLDDVMISWHPRFPTLTKMIRERRGENINIKIPIFNDKNTSMEVTEDEKYPGFIHMDAMGFGMGNACLQMTYSARDMTHARHLYDMFATIGPIGLALTAGSPFFKGKVSDIDVRWPVVAASVDDRTAEERDPANPKFIPKSRYDSVSFYLSNSKMMKDEYNDLKFPVNQEMMEFARENAVKEGVDIDSRFLNHIGFLYMRDPLVIYKDKVILNDKETSAHFENIQSTNWNSVRFKPPSFKADSDCVWRVEYRTPEIGLNEKDNLATIAFINMFVQVVNYEKAAANFYIPMTKLEENMQRSFKRNAILKEKFWFRRFVLPEGAEETKDEFIELTLSEFFYGSDDKKYIGFLEIYNRVIEMMIKEDPSQKEKLEKTRSEYLQALELMLKRAKGEVKTTATYLRQYVMTHPKYNHDSIIPEEILDEISKIVVDINEGKFNPTELLG